MLPDALRLMADQWELADDVADLRAAAPNLPPAEVLARLDALQVRQDGLARRKQEFDAWLAQALAQDPTP